MFAGTPEFAARHLAVLLESQHDVLAVITQPDKPGKRGKKPLPSPVKQLAADHGLDVLQPAKLDLDDISAFDADLMVVVAYGQILRTAVLQALPKGCINVHASLLPRWRGAAPIQRAILAGDTETGVCIMQMDAGLDTGDVLACQHLAIDESDTTESLSGKLAQAGAECLIETLDAIAAGNAHPTPQAEDGVTYASKVSKEEARLDWRQPARALARAVRAFNPDPVAWATMGDIRTRIWLAEASDSAATGQPGEILSLTKRGLEVACGEGALMIKRIQLPFGKGSILTPADLKNAGRQEFMPGSRFDA